MSKHKTFRVSIHGEVELSPAQFFGCDHEEAEDLELKDGLEGLDINELLFEWDLIPYVEVRITDTITEEVYELFDNTLWEKC